VVNFGVHIIAQVFVLENLSNLYVFSLSKNKTPTFRLKNMEDEVFGMCEAGDF